MSVLIRGMEMPKGVSLWLVIRPDGTVYKIKNGANYGEPQTGKAVPIPEKHGRLIDADALMAKEQVVSDRWYVVSSCDVITAPTIIEAEGGGEDG